MKSIAIVTYVFAAVGLLLLGVALLLVTSTNSFLATAVEADGVVVEFSASTASNSVFQKRKPVVEFMATNGEKIESTASLATNPPRYTLGEQVRVLYDAAEPRNFKIDDFLSLWGAATILGALGAAFFLVGGGMLLSGVLTRRRDTYLRSNGTPISADYQRVELNKWVKINGKHPFRILTQWQNPSTSQLHIFKSHNLWFDPSTHIGTKKMTVFVDLSNPKKYCVDLAFLSQVAK